MIIYYSIKNCPSDLLRGISTKFWLRSYFLYFFFLSQYTQIPLPLQLISVKSMTAVARIKVQITAITATNTIIIVITMNTHPHPPHIHAVPIVLLALRYEDSLNRLHSIDFSVEHTTFTVFIPKLNLLCLDAMHSMKLSMITHKTPKTCAFCSVSGCVCVVLLYS